MKDVEVHPDVTRVQVVELVDKHVSVDMVEGRGSCSGWGEGHRQVVAIVSTELTSCDVIAA